MANEIPEWYSTKFADMIDHLAAQHMSYMRGRVDEKMVDNAAQWTVDSIGNGRAHERVTRHQQVKPDDPAHFRRGGGLRTFEKAVMIDPTDRHEIIVEPENPYLVYITEALMREYDRLCLKQAVGTAKTGKNLDTEVTFDADGGKTIPHGDAGLTYNKVMEVRRNFIGSGVLRPGDELFMGISQTEYDSIMKEDKFINRDYTNAGSQNMFGLTRGDQLLQPQVAGLNLVVFPCGDNIDDPMLPTWDDNGTTVRDCIAWIKRGVQVGMYQDIDVKIDQIPQQGYSTQIYASMRFDAIRTEGVRVQKIQCKVS